MKGIRGIVLLFCISGCSAIKVSTDFDKEANFGSYKTYAFTQDAMSLAIDDINRTRIIDAVSKQLAKKGFTRSDQPDVWIDLKLKAQQKQTQTLTSQPTYGYGYAYRWGGGFSTSTIQVENYVEGTLFIDIIDTSRKQLVWQGRGVGTVDTDASSSERQKNINRAVARIFEHYPPKSKK